MQKIAICLFRVSTEKQGISQLGLQSQKDITHRFAENNGYSIAEEFVEVESGRSQDRPTLTRCLQRCRDLNAYLLVARLDRLSRSAIFLLQLQQTKVPFVCCDAPYLDSLSLGFLSLIAQKEAENTAIRTKLALRAARARGTRLGNPRWEESIPKLNEGARTARRKFYDSIRPVVEEIRSIGGVQTYSGIAEVLNVRGIPTRHGGTSKWRANTVRRLILDWKSQSRKDTLV